MIDIISLGFLIATGIVFLLNALADFVLKMYKTFIWDFIMLIWCVVLIWTKTYSVYYTAVTGFIYFMSFWSHIINKKHLSIIVSGVVTVWASYLLTHHS
jgi:hypothetical protein